MSEENTAPEGTPDNPAKAPDAVIKRSGGDLDDYRNLAARAIDALEKKIPEAEATDAKLAEELRDLRSAVQKTDERYEKLWEEQARRGQDGRYWNGGPEADSRVIEEFGERILVGFHSAESRNEGISPWIDVCKPFSKRATDQYEETDSLGGITTPTLTVPDVFRYQKERSLARLLCRVIPVRSDKVDVPSLPSDPTAYYVQQGNAPSSNSAMTFGTDQMTVKTLMAVATVQGELLEDTVIDFMGFWSEVFLDVFSLKENKAVFSETASDTNAAFTGAIQAVAAYNSGSNVVYLGGSSSSGQTHFSVVTYDDLVAVQNTIAEEARDGAVWLGNKAAYRYIQAIRDDNGYPLIQANAGQFPAPNPIHAPELPRPSVLLGDPFYVTAAMPSTMADPGLAVLVYGNFRKGHIFAPRTSFEVQVSTEAAFSQGAAMVRARERYTTINILPAGFATLNIASS